MQNIFIKGKLLKLYSKKKYLYLRTKSSSTNIHEDLLGKYVFLYNGLIWSCYEINNHYYINKRLGCLRNFKTKQISIYRKKKRKKKKGKKGLKKQKKKK